MERRKRMPGVWGPKCGLDVGHMGGEIYPERRRRRGE